jgi:hypothetical protein
MPLIKKNISFILKIEEREKKKKADATNCKWNMKNFETERIFFHGRHARQRTKSNCFYLLKRALFKE